MNLGPNRFTVEITGANLEVSYYDKFGCVFIRSNSSLDHIGVQGEIFQMSLQECFVVKFYKVYVLIFFF